MTTQLQINDVASVKVNDTSPTFPGQDEVIGCNDSVNIGELSCSSFGKFEGDLVAEPRGKSNVHETSETAEATLLSSSLEDILPIKLHVDAEDGSTHNKEKSTSIEAKSVSKEENPVLKKLLRKWRYFDSGDVTFHLEGCAVNSVAQKRRKPCYVCGDAQHNGKKCRKRRRACFTCNGKGHVAEDCPKSDKMYDFCLKCGESGHDLFSCSNDYRPDDLKNIRCYVCNEVGHLCCGSYVDTEPATSSCCNCGESGHSGFECPKPHLEKGSSQPPSVCYKCEEQDHVGRNCTITNTGFPAQKCITNPKGEVLDPMKSDLGRDESGTIDMVMETDDASRGRHERKVRKNKACQCGTVKKQKECSTDSIVVV